MLDIFKRFSNKLKSSIFPLVNRSGFSYLGSTPIIAGKWPLVANAGKISFGRHTVFRSFRAPICLTTLANAVLDIGDNVYMNDGVNICASVSIKIGNYTKIGDMVYIYDTDFHAVSPQNPKKQASVTIGKNVWIGANAMILAGSVIGDHSVIAAGSIVAGKVPAKCVAAGSPAKPFKTFDAPDAWVRE